MAEPSAPGPSRAPRTSPAPLIVHLIPGADTHGVTRHALSLVEAGGVPITEHAAEHGTSAVRIPPRERASAEAAEHEAARLLAALPPGAHAHLHLTDSLLAHPAATVAALAAEHPLSLTLHDIPTPAEGEARYARRAALYAHLTALSRLVVVASEHERELLRKLCADHRPGEPAPCIAVVPLPIRAPGPEAVSAREAGAALEPVVGVLGFLYPGKGHAEGIHAAAAAGLRGVVALGAVSPGHESDARALAQQAHEAGLTWEITGFLPDAELARRARSVALPLAHHAHVSASGSIGTWIEAGRRPLVADGPWVRELAARCPGTVHITTGNATGTGTHSATDTTPGLAADARRLAADPASTWIAADVRVGPSPAEAWAALDTAIHDGIPARTSDCSPARTPASRQGRR